MFEKYTERARRAIFFARYEASQSASGYIETDHLLLGLLREDSILRQMLPTDAPDSIRQQATEGRAGTRAEIPTSVDMPLSDDCKRALGYAAEESERMGQRVITCGHIVLGLLRVENCMAEKVLRHHGVNLQYYKEVVQTRYRGDAGKAAVVSFDLRSAAAPRRPSPELKVCAGSLSPAVIKLNALIDRCAQTFDSWGEADASQKLKRRAWTRKEALGYLSDWAATYQRWIARALTEPKLMARFYPQPEWVSAQRYADFPWQELVDLWVCQNRLLVHVLSQVTESKLETPCRIGLDEPVSLGVLVERYVDHCEDEVGQILTHG